MSEYKCFVIMPFLPELHYFYLYLKYHIEEKHPSIKFRCDRGDSKILTSLLRDKIINYVKDADVIIADCSGLNPNVFYELGIAHARGKQVILITNDSKIPTDLNNFEFIKYELDKDVDFFKKLDDALTNVFVETYTNLYRRATDLFNEIKAAIDDPIEMANEEDFTTKVKDAEATSKLPSMADDYEVALFVIPKIIVGYAETDIGKKVNDWLFRRWGPRKLTIHNPQA